MKKLQDLVNQNPKFKSDREGYLKLAVKEGDVVRGTGPHKVKLVGCENAVNKDYRTQKEIKGVNLLLEENGEPKKYFVPTLGDDGKFHYLIERFAEIDEGTELILEYRRKEGSVKGFIEVKLADEKEVEIAGEETIPIVEDKEEVGSPKEEAIPIVEENGTLEEDIR